MFSRAGLSGHAQLAGFRGAPQTVALIRQYALESQRRPFVRLFAEEIVAGLDPKDYGSEILAINNYITAKTRYANDPRTIELVKRPERILKEILAGKRPSIDCDDYVCTLSAMLMALGRHVRIVTVAFRKMTYQGRIQYSHVFMQAQEPRTKVWITLDPVAADDTEEMLRNIKSIKYWPVAA